MVADRAGPDHAEPMVAARPAMPCRFRRHDHGPTGQALGDIVVGDAGEPDLQPAPQECAQGLPGRTTQADSNRRRDRTALDFPGQRRSEGSLARGDRQAVEVDAAVAAKGVDEMGFHRRRRDPGVIPAGTCRIGPSIRTGLPAR